MTDETASEDTEVVDQDVTVLIAGPNFARRRFRAQVKRLRPYLYGALGVVVLITSAWLLYFSSVLTARSVDVTGNGTVGAVKIERAAQVPLGRQLIRVDLAAIEARVAAIPSIASASVSRSWPHTIHISVVPRVPIAIVDRGTGLQAVDVTGALFGSYNHAPADLPVMRTEPNVSGAALAQGAKAITSLSPAIAAQVAHVDVTSVDAITFRLSSGITVTWGSADNSDQKAEVLAALLDHVSKKNPVTAIDVSVPGRPTTR